MATSTDVPIYTNTLTSGAASVTIPLSDYQMYTNLKLVVTAQRGITGSGGGGLNITLNGDSGNNYATTLVYEAPNSLHDTNGPRFVYMGGVGDGHMMLSTISFMDYSNTNKFKSVIGRWGSSTSGEVRMGVGTWLNTAAITSITMAPPNGFAAGSTISIYGVGTASPAKATGGAIYSDSNYWYHVFANTAAFVPTQSLSCDVMLVAGGGGGGARVGGGGGAGGYRLLSGISASATSYTVTVGAGGTGQVYSGANATSGTNSSVLSNSATGGGYGGMNSGSQNGATGGSGGGANGNATLTGSAGNAGSYTPVEGYAGGNSTFVPSSGAGGGGGGAAAAGSNGISGIAGTGGAGIAVSSAWLVATGVGKDGYIAGGGGGGTESGYTAGVAGIGGGGTGSSSAIAATSGYINTGSGGGGGGCCSSNQNGGNGASGIVIVRYAR